MTAGSAIQYAGMTGAYYLTLFRRLWKRKRLNMERVEVESKPGSFATCLSCMDGRVTLPVTQYIKEKHGVEFVDYITEAGIDGFLSHFGALDGILRKIDISFQKHHSTIAY